MDSIKDKTIKGVGWSAIDNVASYTVSFIIGVVLARLLSPADYGLTGIVTIFTTISMSLIQCGFSSALIRKKEVTEDDYNTVFVINIAISILLYLIIFACAPLISVFFEREELTLLIRISTTTIIIGAFTIVQYTRLTKNIDFKSQTKITLIASIGSGIIGIILAFLGCGVWALVAQGLVSRILTTIFYIYFNRWFPSFKYNKYSFKDLFGYGWKMMISNLINNTWNELYQVVIGKFYNPATLGQYTRAQGFSRMFSSNLTNIIQRVTFPTLSNIQDDQIRMVNAYRKIIKITMFGTFVCMFFLGAIAEPLIYCLIGPKWHDAAVYLPFICLIGSLYPLHSINLNMLQVQGRSDLFLILEIVKKSISIIPLVIGALVGIIPMLIVSNVTNIVSFFLNSYFTGKKLNYNSFMQIKDVAPSFFVALAIAIPIYFIKFIPLSMWFILPIQLFVGIALFFAICYFSKNEEYGELVCIARQYISKLKR